MEKPRIINPRKCTVHVACKEGVVSVGPGERALSEMELEMLEEAAESRAARAYFEGREALVIVEPREKPEPKPSAQPASKAAVTKAVPKSERRASKAEGGAKPPKKGGEPSEGGRDPKADEGSAPGGAPADGSASES